MSEVLLTYNQRYTMGIESGSTKIVDSSDGAEGKQIIRNNMIISGAHDPAVFGDVPTVTLLKGQNLGLNIIDTGSVVNANHAQLRLTCMETGDTVMQYQGNYGLATPIFTTGIDATDGFFKIAHTSTLTSTSNTCFSIASGQDIVSMSADVHIVDNLKVGGDVTIVDDLTVGDNVMVTGSSAKHHVHTSVSGYASYIRNRNNNDSNYGLYVQAGKDSNPTSTCYFLGFYDGDGGGSLDRMIGDGAGGIKFTGQAQSVYSDIRNKNSIIPIEESTLNPQDMLNNIDVIEFKYNSYDWLPDEVKDKKDSERRIGVSAQAIESSSLAYIVHDNDPMNKSDNIKPGEKGFKWKEVNYEELVPLLIQTSKEQDSRIKILEDRISKLEEKI